FRVLRFRRNGLSYDDAFRRRSLFGVVPGRLPERWITDGFVMRANTIAELASQCGIDAGGLEATVRGFNEFRGAGGESRLPPGGEHVRKVQGRPEPQAERVPR